MLTGWMIFWWVIVAVVTLVDVAIIIALPKGDVKNLCIIAISAILVIMLIFGIAFFIPWTSGTTLSSGHTWYYVSETTYDVSLNLLPVAITLTNQSSGLDVAKVTMLVNGSSRFTVNKFTFNSGLTSDNKYYISIQNESNISVTLGLQSKVTYQGPFTHL